ncbi:nuclear apoptosis-inducing factor 1-like [Mytilus edulis]|uniref:nuclear apoptosis-inducing factor 1-like n=1 Tax=Mytilus edulis TaxID=6550 RepID=UPI0039EE42C2
MTTLLIESQKGILFSKHSTVATNAAKKRAWESICTKVNACNLNHKRTAEEIKKKWSTFTSTVTKQASFVRREAKKTGGGPPPDSLTPLQNKVVGIIGIHQLTALLVESTPARQPEALWIRAEMRLNSHPKQVSLHILYSHS